MFLSLEWLSTLVDLDGLAPEEVAQRLTSSTAEVEGIEERESGWTGVVAEVVAAPAGKLLHDGSETLPLAPEDASIETGAKVVIDEAGRLAAPPASGPDPWRVDGAVPAGTRIGDLVPARDTLIELDNKSLTHRPDLWGHYGFARELSAIFSRELRALEQLALDDYGHLAPLPVEIESPDCSYYSAIAATCAAAGPSPLRVEWRLAMLGQRSRGLAVDLSNYVMLELAQPTHAFDGAHVGSLRTAPAGESMSFTGVDEIERRLEPEDLLIWADARPVGLAGIIGARESGIAPATTRVVLESANFAAARVRRTQTRLGLRTDAGQRFEKSQPWRMAPVAAARFLALLLEADPSATVDTRFSRTQSVPDVEPATISVPVSYFGHRAGIAISHDRAVGVLEDLRFEVDERDGELQVKVPAFRSERDVSQRHDLLEEVARIIGYDNIEPELPPALTRPAPLAETLTRERHVRSALAVSHGFVEMRTYHWFDDKWLAQIGFEPRGALELRNATAPHLGRLRTTLVPNLLAVARQNSHRPEQGRIFEIGHVYAASVSGFGAEERAMVAGVVWDRVRAASEIELLRATRGALEDLLAIVRPTREVRWTVTDSVESWEAPGSTLRLTVGPEHLGTIGVAASETAGAVGRRLRMVTFELDLDALGRVSPKPVTFRAPTVFPGSWFDLSLQWPAARGYETLVAALSIEDPLLAGRDFLEVFPGDEGRSSYTFRFWVEAPDRTLTTEEVEAVRARLLGAAQAAGAVVRSASD